MANEIVEELPYPRVPSLNKVSSIEDVNSVLEDHTRFFREIGRFQDDLYSVIHNGQLVREWRIESLTADKIIAGVISTDQVYLFDDKFELNGALQQIIVKDGQGTPVTRVEIGKFGSGSDFGIKIRNASGTVVFQATSTTFMDGAVINNATLNGAALVDATLNGTKLINGTIGTSKVADAAITNAKIANLSADKITVAGTLTCNSTATAIDVTSGGVVLLRNGADIIMRASASGDTTYLSFRTSADSARGNLSYSVADNEFRVRSVNGATLRLFNLSGVNEWGINIDTNITLSPEAVTVSAGNFRPEANNTRSCGISTHKWAHMWTVVDHVGDIAFDNGWRLTEPDKVYKDSRLNGLLIMNSKWQVVGGFDEIGNLWVRGWVKPLHDFLPPDIPRRESKEEEQLYAGRTNTSLN